MVIYVADWGGRNTEVYGKPLLSVQFCCKPTIALSNKVKKYRLMSAKVKDYGRGGRATLGMGNWL
jgi:hypothetical protein